MTAMHRADLAARLTRFLDRRQMPRRIEGKPTAIEDETTALVDKLVRYAPRGADAVAAWWPAFEARLGEAAAGGLWPTEREVVDCAKAAVADARSTAGAAFAADAEPIGSPEWSRRVWAERFQRGEPVAETMLYGRAAVELIAEGRIERETMERYRSGAFLARRALYGHDDAAAWEAYAKRQHDEARAVHRGRNGPRGRTAPTTPDMTMPTGADHAD